MDSSRGHRVPRRPDCGGDLRTGVSGMPVGGGSSQGAGVQGVRTISRVPPQARSPQRIVTDASVLSCASPGMGMEGRLLDRTQRETRQEPVSWSLYLRSDLAQCLQGGPGLEMEELCPAGRAGCPSRKGRTSQQGRA